MKFLYLIFFLVVYFKCCSCETPPNAPIKYEEYAVQLEDAVSKEKYFWEQLLLKLSTETEKTQSLIGSQMMLSENNVVNIFRQLEQTFGHQPPKKNVKNTSECFDQKKSTKQTHHAVSKLMACETKTLNDLYQHVEIDGLQKMQYILSVYPTILKECNKTSNNDVNQLLVCVQQVVMMHDGNLKALFIMVDNRNREIPEEANTCITNIIDDLNKKLLVDVKNFNNCI